MEHRTFQFKSVGVDERGVFQGKLGVYSNIDRVGDVLEPGSVSKSIQENPKIPMLWAHDSSKPIGVISLSDSPQALMASGKINLGIQSGIDAYNVLKFNAAAGLKSGLSVGYRTIREKMVNGIRHLLEVAVLEGSIVSLPANELATVDSVKHVGGGSDELDEMVTHFQRELSKAIGRPSTPRLTPEWQSVVNEFGRRLQAAIRS